MSDYYCLISIANDRICSICGASFRNLPFLPGKGEGGGEDFSGKMETVVTSSRYVPKQIHVYVRAHMMCIQTLVELMIQQKLRRCQSLIGELS